MFSSAAFNATRERLLASAREQNRAREVRERVETLYRKHNPEKLAMVDQLLEKWKGREREFILKLENKYEAGAHANAIDAAEAEAERQRAAAHHARLVAFYREHNPSKLGRAAAFLEKWKGREEEMFARLNTKYGVQPSAPAREENAVEAAEAQARAQAQAQAQAVAQSQAQLQAQVQAQARVAGAGGSAPGVVAVGGGDGGGGGGAGLEQQQRALAERRRTERARADEQLRRGNGLFELSFRSAALGLDLVGRAELGVAGGGGADGMGGAGGASVVVGAVQGEALAIGVRPGDGLVRVTGRT
eukprot:g6674.t1